MKAILALVLVVALIGVISIGIVDSKSDNANPAAPGQTGDNPGHGNGAGGPPGQTGRNPGQSTDWVPPV
jgi:hypothetical protein